MAVHCTRPGPDPHAAAVDVARSYDGSDHVPLYSAVVGEEATLPVLRSSEHVGQRLSLCLALCPVCTVYVDCGWVVRMLCGCVLW